MCYKRNGVKSLLFGWFLAPSCDDHECAYACMRIAILCLKVDQKQVCEQSLYVEKI